MRANLDRKNNTQNHSNIFLQLKTFDFDRCEFKLKIVDDDKCIIYICLF